MNLCSRSLHVYYSDYESVRIRLGTCQVYRERIDAPFVDEIKEEIQ